MSAPLLMTKLYIPPVRPELVSRPRLIERLDRGLRLGHRLTLISAPAGFGKTTLLSEWASRRVGESASGRPVTWLSLDEGDNDPARFLAYLIAALQRIEKGIGADALDALRGPQPPSPEEILAALINQINVALDHPSMSSGGRLALVLDDYHLITAQPVHDALTFLLDHLPASLHVLVSTRADPPLPIARLRGRGQLTELRLADLRFTHDEAATFLNQVMGLGLSAQDVGALAARTEGWIAGLQMAAVSMQGRDDVAGFIRTFTGSNRHVLDYLVEEVLQRQPQPIQTFLLRTSILDRLSGPLCDAVVGREQEPGAREQGAGTGDQETFLTADPQSLVPDHRSPIPGSQSVLEYLEHANLFIVPLDDRREWYRYHHLFADLLRQRLWQVQPDQVPVLHRRASAWYEQNGLATAAIGHALSAMDPERAAYLVEQSAESTLMRSEFATFLGWIEALPGEWVRTRPRLCLYYALSLVLNGHPLDIARSHIQHAVEADVDGSIAGEVTAFHALIAAYQGDTRQSVELAQRALELLPETDLFFRSFVAGFVGLNYLYSGDIAPATRAFEEAIRVSQRTGNLTVAVLARCHLAELALLKCQLEEVRVLYEQALALATDEGGRRWPIAGIALIGLARLRMEWNELQVATRYLTEGIELIGQWGEVGAINGYIYLARVRQVQGDVTGACEAIHTAQRLAANFDAAKADDVGVTVNQVHLWLAQGNLEAATRWIQERGLDQEIGPAELEERISGPHSLYRAAEWVAAALVRVTQGRPDEAISLLEPLYEAAKAAGWTWFLVEILIVEALALQARGDLAQATVVLGCALSLAQPAGLVLTFVEKGEPMAALLRQAAAQGIAVDYVNRLLAAPSSTQSAVRTPQSATRSLVEPLSERELEVLRLLATSLSTADIADGLYVAVSTVRSHTKSIYAKLNVHHRWDAVERARELGLI